MLYKQFKLQLYMYFVLECDYSKIGKTSCCGSKLEPYRIYLNPKGILLDHHEIEKEEISINQVFLRNFWTNKTKEDDLQFWKISNFQLLIYITDSNSISKQYNQYNVKYQYLYQVASGFPFTSLNFTQQESKKFVQSENIKTNQLKYYFFRKPNKKDKKSLN